MSDQKADEELRVIEEYQKTFSGEKIDEFLGFLINQKITFNAWLKDEKGERITYRLKIDGERNPYEPEIKVILGNDSQQKDFSKMGDVQNLYIHTDSKRYVCEVQVVYRGDEHLFILPPDALFVKEQRRVPRIQLRPDEKQVQFIKDKKEYIFSLIDISQTGMAFSIPPAKAKIFSYAHDNIQIFKIFGNELESSILGSIVYIKKMDEDRRYRVGVQFYDEIDIAAYETIK